LICFISPLYRVSSCQTNVNRETGAHKKRHCARNLCAFLRPRTVLSCEPRTTLLEHAMSSAVVIEREGQGRSAVATDPVRESLSRFILRVLNEEVETYIQRHASIRDASGHAMVTRNGRGATRTLHLDDGALQLRAPRVNDRRVGTEGRRVRYASSF